MYMILAAFSTCKSCGKTFHEWSCDHCYTKSVFGKFGE